MNNYNIKYIENSERNRMVNKINQSDKRLRLDIVNFKYKNDTVRLYLVDCSVIQDMILD